MKNLWKPVAAVLAAALLFTGAVISQVRPAHADTPQAADQRTITVTGTGQMNVAPDVAVINVGVMTQGDTAQAVESSSTAAIEKVLSTLQSLGIKKDDIQTQGYSISPRYSQPKDDGAPAISGFQAYHNLSVTVRNLDQVGVVLDAAIRAGANQVNGVSYMVSDPATWQIKSYDAAIQQARAKADAIAKSLGMNVVGVLRADAQDGGIISPVVHMAQASAASPVPVQPGLQTISTSVQVTYLIGPAGGN